MPDRWATFDCYGTLIDWNRGVGDALQGLWPEADRAALLRSYHEAEPHVQSGASLPYREVMGRCTQRVADALGLSLPPGAETALAESLPTWSPFPEVPGALQRLSAEDWRLAVLSNADPDLLATSVKALAVAIDLTVTVAEAGSYKPAPGHWAAFRRHSGVLMDRHVHVAASLFHDIVPCAELGIPAVWINREGETSDVPRVGELTDCRELAPTLGRIVGP